MAHDVFISYAKEDKRFADDACASLESEGISCWIAPRDVGPGIWAEEIISAIKESKVMVLIFSSNANRSEHIMREVNQAIETGLSVLTFRIENVPFTGALEYYLEVVQWMDAVDPPLEKQLGRLNENVKQLLGLPRRPTPPPAPSPPPSRPFPKWWLGLGAGLLAAFLLLVVWFVMKPDGGPVGVVNQGSPTPAPAQSSNSSPAAVVNANTNSNAVALPTQPPASVNSSPVPADDTDTRIAEAARVLGDPNANANIIEQVRAINALESLATKSLKHHLEVVNILAIYLRNNAKWQGGTNRSDKPAPDNIQAAITALGRRKWTYKNQENQPLELSGLDLRGVVFRIEGMRANFDGARLVRTHLNEAILMDTDFRYANLTGAFMKGVDVNGTDFCDAILAPAESVESEMRMAHNRNKKCEP